MGFLLQVLFPLEMRTSNSLKKITINNAKKARGKGEKGEKERNTAEIKKLKWSLTKRTPTGPPFEAALVGSRA